MTAMSGVSAATVALSIGRPATPALAVAVVAALAGWALSLLADRASRPPAPEATGDRRPAPSTDRPIEPPAVMALLTNGYDVPTSAVTATVLDLAARGWIRLATVGGELVVVTRGAAVAGDQVRPYEQQVFNHLAGRAFNDVSSAGTLAISQRQLNRRWWMRFDRSVAEHAAELGFTRPRYTPVEILPAALCTVTGLLTSWLALRRGTDVALADSWQSRTLWVVATAALLALAWRVALRATSSAQRPTEAGARRAGEWLGYRSRLRSRIPSHASVLAPPPQQLALAHAVVMGVAEHVQDELPVVAENPREAWSEAGGTPHVVRVRYPMRPGYGQHPMKLAVAGVVVLLVARWLMGFFGRVADGEALESLLARAPGQIDLIETVAGLLSRLCWIPILLSLWAIVAGAIDSVATRERVGLVVRARRPVDVLPLANVIKPFAERDRFSTYLAVDDGHHTSIAAWLASERTAAPQGAQARVRATPLLGYVRSSEPVGTATRRPGG